MQEAVKIEEMGIEDLSERYHIGEEENPYGVSYGEGMVVSHNYIPINIKEKPEVLNHPIRTKFSILFLCTKGNITVRCNSHECRIQANTLFVCKPGSVVQFIDGSLSTRPAPSAPSTSPTATSVCRCRNCFPTMPNWKR